MVIPDLPDDTYYVAARAWWKADDTWQYSPFSATRVEYVVEGPGRQPLVASQQSISGDMEIRWDEGTDITEVWVFSDAVGGWDNVIHKQKVYGGAKSVVIPDLPDDTYHVAARSWWEADGTWHYSSFSDPRVQYVVTTPSNNIVVGSSLTQPAAGGSHNESSATRVAIDVWAVADFDSATGALTVTTSGAADAGIVARNDEVHIVSGGQNVAMHDREGTRVDPDAVASITVIGTDSDNRINLSAVTTTTFPNLTSVRIEARGGNDTVLGSQLADYIHGGRGDDCVDGMGGDDSMNGGLGDDVLRGGDGNDRLFGRSGEDTLTGGLGNDKLNGGSGTDTLVESAQVDFTLTERRLCGLGTDRHSRIDRAELIGGPSANVLRAETFSGDVILRESPGDNAMASGSDNDYLDGRDGAGVLCDGTADSTLIGSSSSSSDALRESGGLDISNAGDGGRSLHGGSGNDSLLEHDANDALVGVIGNVAPIDDLRDDPLSGDSGNDERVASADADLSGGNLDEALLAIRRRHENGMSSATEDSGTDERDVLALSAEADTIDEEFLLVGDWIDGI